MLLLFPLLRRCHLLFPARLLVLLLVVVPFPLLPVLRPVRLALVILLPRQFIIIFFLLPIFIFIFIFLLLFFFLVFLSFFFFFGRPRASRCRS